MSPVGGATIEIRGRAIVADEHGRFTVGELAGPVDVTATAPGYEAMTDTIRPEAPPVILLFATGRHEVIQIHDKPPPSAAATTVLSRDEIRALPGGGEDALAAVRSLPGVGQAPPTTAGRLVIRGAAPEDTRMTVDGISVPFLYHTFNNTTVLPVASVGGIEFTPGGFGVEEGRATGGVVTLSTIAREPARPTGEVSVSLLEVAANAAATISHEHHVAIAAGLRRSTVDLLAPFAVPKGADVGFTTAPRFYDGQLRLDWRASESDTVSLLGMLAYDALGVVNKDEDSDLPSAFAESTKFARLIASWKHKSDAFDNRLVGALGYDRWLAEIGIDQNVDGKRALFAIRDDARVSLGEHLQLRAGAIAELADVELHALTFLPPAEGLPPGRVDQLPIYRIEDRTDANYGGAYVATDVMPTSSTTITTGVRVDVFGHLQQARVLPRVQLRQRIATSAGPLALTASLGRYARDFDGPEGIPRDLQPELATQATLGGELGIAEGVTASLGGFATWRRDLVVEDPSKQPPDELPYASGGTGTSRGIEALVRVHRGNFFGWLAYTLSRSDRQDAPSAAVRPFAYDQTHLVSAVASWERGPWRFGGRWQLATGLPYTEVTGATYVDALGHYVPTFGSPFAARLDTAHQLDVRVERTWQRRGYRIAVFADLSNVYRHARILRYQYSDDFMSRKPVSDFIPLPSVGVRGEF